MFKSPIPPVVDPLALLGNAAGRATLINPTRLPTQVSPRITAGQTTKVIASWGQSNGIGCNYVGTALDTPYTVSNTNIHVLNIVNGGCYVAADTLLGGEGQLGSVGIRLADLLRTASWADRIILVPIDYGGLPVANWADPFSLGSDIAVAYRRMSAVGLTPDIIIGAIGESDATASTPQATFAADYQTVINRFRSFGMNAPFLCTYSTYGPSPTGAAAIRAAITSVVDNVTVFAGADTDTITAERNVGDGVHFTQAGADLAAELHKDIVELH
jgi:hypothetical protein